MAQKIEIIASAVGFDKVVKGADNVTKALASTAKETQKLDSKLATFSKGSNQATQSLINLGRVAQDAPFGFIGIANNINPLLESFQRLKAETGSTAQSLEALGSSLLGAGGLGLAVSVISSLLVVFGDKLFSSGKEATKANEEFKKLQDTIQETSETFKQRNVDAIGSTDAEIAKINILSKVIQDQTISYDKRNRALLELQKINKSYFGDLTLESESLKLLTGRVNEYTEALIVQSVIKSFSEDIGKLSVQFAVQLNKLNALNKELDKNNLILSKTKESFTSLTGEDRLSAEFVRAEKAAKKSSQAYKQQADIVTDLAEKLRILKDGFQQAIIESLKFKPLDDLKKDSPLKKVKEDIDSLKKSVLDVNRVITQDFLDKFYGDKTGGVKRENIKPIGVVLEIRDIKEINEAVLQQKLLPLRNQLNDILANTFGNAINGLAESLGEILSGADLSFGDVFKKILNTLASGLSQIGKALVQFGIAKEILKRLSKLHPATAIAVGVGLQIFAAALKNSFKIPGFATGTTNAPGGLALVGERGPELISVPRGSQITPNAQSMNMLGGLQAIEVYGMVSGENIYFSNRRAGQRLSRNS